MSYYSGRSNPSRLKQSLPPQAGIGIPHAPTGRRKVTAADKDLSRWRVMLDKEYPLMSPEEISRAEQPFHALLLHDLIIDGQAVVAQEINNIFRKEERERRGGKYGHNLKGPLLREQRDKLERIADTLKMCYKHTREERFDTAIFLRKQLAEKMMHEGDIWLAKHFFLSSLQACKRLQDGPVADKIQAEVHCLLAFLARENNETLESALALAIDHLAMCRSLSENQPWQFKPRVLTIKLKKPIALHGLRFDENEIYEIVDGCSMTVYMIATLLEHELLISLANQILHVHKTPTEDDVRVAHEFADHALKLAMEVRQPTAVSCALVRFGLVLRHSGAYEDALYYFDQLKQHCIVIGDYTTEAIAYHNIGLSLIGCHNSVKALECFAKQMDIASDFKMKDLEADAMYEIGHLLLQEGHLWEAEECYSVSLKDFQTMEHTASHEDAAWAMYGIAAGQTLWGRYASLCRNNTFPDIYSIADWKCSRRSLHPIGRPNYKPELISKAFEPYLAKMQPQPVVDDTDDMDYERLADDLELSPDSSLQSDPPVQAKKSRRSSKLVGFLSQVNIGELTPDQDDFEVTEANDDLEFDSDYQAAFPVPGSIDAERDRRKKSIRRSMSINLSLKSVIDIRNSE